MENKRDFYKMIADRRRNLKDNVSNCIGTALYLTGEVEDDKYLYGSHEKILKKLVESNIPKLGYLVGWEDKFKEIYHLAVVVKEKPLILSTRNGRNKPFSKNKLFKEVDNKYMSTMWNDKQKNKFFIPSGLQKLLNEKYINEEIPKLKLIQKIKTYIRSWKILDSEVNN